MRLRLLGQLTNQIPRAGVCHIWAIKSILFGSEDYPRFGVGLMNNLRNQSLQKNY